MKRNSLALSAVFLVFAASGTEAKDFGKDGASFPVAEEGFVAMVKRRLKDKDLRGFEEKAKARAKEAVENPSPVEGISRAEKTVSYGFDPGYLLEEDLYLPCGKLLYAAGTTVNPLDYIDWDDELVFIDSRDGEQAEWLKNRSLEKTKIILVGGRPLELEEEIGEPVYFDQAGELTKKFNIAAVPAVVARDGKLLRITEIDIGSKKK